MPWTLVGCPDSIGHGEAGFKPPPDGERMSGTGTTDTLSEALLRDFHVADAAVALVDLGPSPLGVSRASAPRLHLVLDGAVTIHCGDYPPERLGAGDAILIFYGDAHRILTAGADGRDASLPPLSSARLQRIDAARGDRRAALLSFEVELSYIAPAAGAIRAGPPFCVMRRDAGTDQLPALGLDPHEIEAACSGPGARAFCLALANLLVVHGMRAMYRAQWRDVEMEVRSPTTRRVAAAMQAIEAHPERPWTVASLAQTVGISRSSFAATFRATLGVAPLAYLRDVRLERARRLLDEGGMSVTEVARRSGYPLPSSFARAFAQRYGRPPSRRGAGG
jgi:AraC-like DNA-binding protein